MIVLITDHIHSTSAANIFKILSDCSWDRGNPNPTMHDYKQEGGPTPEKTSQEGLVRKETPLHFLGKLGLGNTPTQAKISLRLSPALPCHSRNVIHHSISFIWSISCPWVLIIFHIYLITPANYPHTSRTGCQTYLKPISSPEFNKNCAVAKSILYNYRLQESSQLILNSLFYFIRSLTTNLWFMFLGQYDMVYSDWITMTSLVSNWLRHLNNY